MSNYEPRTIAFGAELLHPPIQLRADLVQRVHNELFQRPELAYHNFGVAQDGIHLTNLSQAQGQISSATFLPDRIVFREELRGITVEDFATRIVNVAGVAYRTLGVAQSVAQQFWVRSLVNPQTVTDSRAFVAEHLLADGSASLPDFGRPVHSVGLRLSFGAPAPSEPTLNLRIEPWIQEPRSLWLEVIGQFNASLPAAQIPEVGAGLFQTYRFMTGPALDFVARYDVP